MLTLSAKIRKDLGRRVKVLRRKGILPAILYGPKIKNLPLEVDLEEFGKVYKKAGETTIIELEVKNRALKAKKFLILIKEITRDALTGELTHVDFLQPLLKEEIEATVPLVFEGKSNAVENLEGTLVENISEVEVKALPQNLPKEIKINIESLKTFEDEILIKDLLLPAEVKILRKPDDVVATISPPEKVEEELEKPLEEKVEEVEKVKKVEEKKEEEEQKEKPSSAS